MNHASAKFVFGDGSVLHGEYDGTSDIMMPKMFDTHDEMEEMWRKQEWKKCECGGGGERCLAYTSYGYGFSWIGLACRKCMIFIGENEPEEVKNYSQLEYFLINS